jgi:hypothetical protein
MIDNTNHLYYIHRKSGLHSNPPSFIAKHFVGLIFHFGVIVLFSQINRKRVLSSTSFKGFSLIAYSLMTSLLTPIQLKGGR